MTRDDDNGNYQRTKLQIMKQNLATIFSSMSDGTYNFAKAFISHKC